MRIAGVFLLALLCACTNALEPRVGEEFTMGPGRVVPISGTQLSVQFMEVVEDSRCPTRVQCVWAGDGVVQLKITGGPESPVGDREYVIMILHTNPEFAREGALGDVVFTLVSLNPYPDEPGSIEPDGYEVTLSTRVSE